MVVQHVSLPVGQLQARTRWGTHDSGEVFDRKKSLYLTDDAQHFIAQQALCAIAGLDSHDRITGLLALDIPGFVRIVDKHTCLIRLNGCLWDSPILQRLYETLNSEKETHLGLFFICHVTKERLCVQGTAELIQFPVIMQTSQAMFEAYGEHVQEDIWIHLHVRQSFFHCAKYIKTRIPGLTFPLENTLEHTPQWTSLLPHDSLFLSEEVRAFIAAQRLCYLCTVDSEGQCAINHRGGTKGFLVTLPPAPGTPHGMILLPDYTGNGAFEAIGNIFETEQAAMVVPDFVEQMACCISGSAMVLDVHEVTPDIAQQCVGAERVVALSVERITMQKGNWSAALAYERIRAEKLFDERIQGDTCSL